MRLVFFPPVASDWIADIASLAPDLEVINASTEGEALVAIADADAFCGQITPALLSPAQRLRWIQAPRIGLEHYMFPELVHSSVVLTNARGILADLVADHALALVLCLARQLHIYMQQQRESLWQRHVPLVDLPSATMGIIGLGGIGTEVAKRAAAFGMRIVAVDPRRTDVPREVAELWGTDRLHDLLACADFVVICAPHTPETERMIGAAQLRMMKKTAYLVNVGRGAIVDLDALTEALREGLIAGAGLDVFAVEPLPSEHALWRMPNVVISPHAASECPTDKVAVRRKEVILDNIRRFVCGEPLRYIVDKAAWY